jgi:hypothetical protein
MERRNAISVRLRDGRDKAANLRCQIAGWFNLIGERKPNRGILSFGEPADEAHGTVSVGVISKSPHSLNPKGSAGWF